MYISNWWTHNTITVFEIVGEMGMDCRMLEEKLASLFCQLTDGLMGWLGLCNLSKLLMLELLHSDCKVSIYLLVG
jgi:hypothetical protein